jgi:hypothetical protein
MGACRTLHCLLAALPSFRIWFLDSRNFGQKGRKMTDIQMVKNGAPNNNEYATNLA